MLPQGLRIGPRTDFLGSGNRGCRKQSRLGVVALATVENAITLVLALSGLATPYRGAATAVAGTATAVVNPGSYSCVSLVYGPCGRFLWISLPTACRLRPSSAAASPRSPPVRASTV